MTSYPLNPPVVFSDRLLGLMGSSLLHLFIFLMGTKLLIEPVQYGVEIGQGGIEINLIAATPLEEGTLSEDIIASTEAMTKKEASTLSATEKEEASELVEEKLPLDVSRPQKIQRGVSIQDQSAIQRESSALDAGRDLMTLTSTGGAQAILQAAYLKNLVPVYPPRARLLGQEGLVRLLVTVTKEGTAKTVTVIRSSGFLLLDEAAMGALWKWKFRPANVGGLAVDSQVEIPIRFKLF